MTFPFFSAHCSHHCSSFRFHRSPITLFSSSSIRRNRWLRMDAGPIFSRNRWKEKVIVIMGATGAGKSSLSIDLATRFPFSEIINSDKMQVYTGLDITTNKIPIEERKGVPHHLLGDVDPQNGEFTPLDFRLRAGSVISDITSRRKIPIVVGGSNSFVHALLADRFDPEINVFDGSSSSSSLISSELRYDCCFLWVDVSFPLLSDYLMKRVDDMLDMGMVEELAEFFNPDADDLEDDSENRTGLRKAIGVQEFDPYFKRYPPPAGLSAECTCEEDRVRKGAYEDAVRAIKDNTGRLVKKQIEKILRLRGSGWDLRRVDATEVFRAKLGKSSGGRWSEIWEREVLEPSVKIVSSFLRE
ncbi:adenylate isopentenyltransferase-like [Neltuma alba]|uniref:adenylate isopentenyltransferase-like n=1 Tax=Neltuma alba TaxID=207710 RepID=UPI0010A59786|nr:adenylate isopentenyltransferase-like [Prosopis alba]